MKTIYSTILIVGDDLNADTHHLRANRIIPIKSSEINNSNHYITHLCGIRANTIIILDKIDNNKLDDIVELITPGISDGGFMNTKLEIIKYYEKQRKILHS